MKRERKNKQSTLNHKKIGVSQKNNSPDKSIKYNVVSTSQIVIWLTIITTITILAYSSAFNNKLTNWDDNEYVTENKLIKKLNTESISTIFTTISFMGNYHPLAIISLAIDYQISYDNGKLSPLPFHTTNIILHLIITLLVFWFVYKLFDNFTIAVISSLLFGVSTIHVESVAWVAERKDVLYSAFFVAGLVNYLYFLDTKKTSSYLLTLFLFILSLLSKGQAVSLAVSLVIIDWVKGRNLLDKKVILEKIPFFILALCFGILAIFAQKAGNAIVTGTDYPFVKRIIIASYAFMQYLFELTVPVGFSAINPYQDLIHKTIPGYYYLFLPLSLGVVYGFYYTLRKEKKIAFAIGFFILNIFMLLQLLPVGSAIHADRYAYIPSIGYFIFIAVLATNFLKKRQKLKYIVFTIIGIFAAIQAYATYNRSKVWADSETLWNDTVKKSPRAVVAWNNRGSIHDKKAQNFADNLDFENERKYRKLAIKDFTEAIRWKPDYVHAYYNRGSSTKGLAKLENSNALRQKAIADFDSALQYDPVFAEAYQNRGVTLDELGESDKAILDISNAIDLKPSVSIYYVNRGVAYGKLNKLTESINDFNTSISLDPNNASVYSNRGYAKVLSKDIEGGLADYQKAIDIDPNFYTVFYNRAILYQNLGKYEKAIADYTSVININPNNANTFLSRGYCYTLLLKKENACADFNAAKNLGKQDAEKYIEKYCK